MHQNSSAHVARRRHLDAAAVLAHGSPQTPIGVWSRWTKLILLILVHLLPENVFYCIYGRFTDPHQKDFSNFLYSAVYADFSAKFFFHEIFSNAFLGNFCRGYWPINFKGGGAPLFCHPSRLALRPTGIFNVTKFLKESAHAYLPYFKLERNWLYYKNIQRGQKSYQAVRAYLPYFSLKRNHGKKS